MFEIFLVEFVCTTLFVSLIMTIKYHTPSNEGILGAASVATTLFGMINLSGGITGACLNPAVGFCQSLVQSKMIDSTLPHIDGGPDLSANIGYGSLWIYVVATSLGGAAAGIFQIGNGLAQRKLQDSSTTYGELK